MRGTGGGTRSGRPSTSNPNFLNIPKEFKQDHDMSQGNEWGLPPLPFVRNYILPDPGGVFMHRDFDGQEMRIFANYEEGPLLRAYQADPDLDPHKMVQDEIVEMFDVLLARTDVKNMNFLGLYGGGIPGIIKKLKCNRAKAEEYRMFHDQALPGRQHLNDCIREVINGGDPIRTWGGRCYFQEENKIIAGQMRNFLYKLINYL